MKHKFLILVVLALALFTLVGSLSASPSLSENTQLKQIAAPPSEMSANALPQASLNGIRSHAAMIPVQITSSAKEGLSWESSIAVDSVETLTMMLLAPEDATWTLSVQQPEQNGKLTENNKFESVAVQSTTTFGMGNNQYPGDVYTFAAPNAGEWTVRVSGLTEKDAGVGYLVISSDSQYQLYSHLADYNLLVGEQIGLVTRLFDSEQGAGQTAVPQALAASIEKAELQLTLPDGTKQSLPMFDDGSNLDGIAGDGIFGATFSAKAAGEYLAHIVVSGTSPDGRRFLRTSEHVFPVLEPALTLHSKQARLSQAENNRVNINLVGEAFNQKTDRFIVSAEVWGSDSSGTAVPITWLSGIVAASIQKDNALMLPLSLDLGWVDLAGAQAPYSLRNVRVQDVDTAIPLAQLEHVSFLLDYKADTTKATAVTDEMLMGAKPENMSANASAAGVVMLIHGYCSGSVWPTSHFSSYAVFSDHDQNRSHDQFAQLIDSYGNNFSSFGAVAHSQGGAASLHLYTYYWSGLDYSSGNRLIQSVGTPYQGTALAGNLAVLGDIFGVGCGTNWDLTYDGASLWLSNIPSWARSRVYYHTTAFRDVWWRYDYCHIASDLFLNDPDDGTTERWAGQLSGANNLGHKSGQCHTTGMRDMPQYHDSSRNANMNANANR